MTQSSQPRSRGLETSKTKEAGHSPRQMALVFFTQTLKTKCWQVCQMSKKLPVRPTLDEKLNIQLCTGHGITSEAEAGGFL